MSIIVCVAKSVSAPHYRQVEAMVHRLENSDYNFKDRAIRLERGFATVVTDTKDVLRGALLQLIVDSVINIR
ncbi:MAG: hypothetical protein EON54_16730 [Alcaligenaceae bacterium]|nr:MAG: hypothetical protein EON54_16730 [Alcaligenaceae bacterium]